MKTSLWLIIGVLTSAALAPQKAGAGPVWTSSGYDQYSGNGHISGDELVPNQMHGHFGVSPEYGKDGTLSGFAWSAGVYANGGLVRDGVITDEMRNLASNDREMHTRYEISSVNFVEDDEWGYYQFNTVLSVILDYYAGGYIRTYGGGGGKGLTLGGDQPVEQYNGYLDAYLSVSGPSMTIDSVSLGYNEKVPGNTPLPEWIPEYESDIHFAGHFDALGSGVGFTRVVVPEPASLAMMGVGGAAIAGGAFRRGRRLAEQNLIPQSKA